MRLGLLLCLATAAGCGTLASGPGAPENPPSSGLGASTPWDDDSGLDWTAPFIFADAGQAFSHPSAIVSGDAIDLWVDARRGDEHTVVHASTSSFEHGFSELETTWTPPVPSQAELSPAVVVADERRYLFFVTDGKLQLVRFDPDGLSHPRVQPLYVDPNGGAITSAGAARLGDAIRVVVLAGDAIVEGALALSALAGDVDALRFSPTPSGVPLPPWASSFLDVSLRIEPTGAGRLREDLLFAATLPSFADLGMMTAPSGIGAASRYLDPPDLPYETVATPILSGSPPPRGPALVSYRGGTLLLYGARSGPRQAIGVARHP